MSQLRKNQVGSSHIVAVLVLVVVAVVGFTAYRVMNANKQVALPNAPSVAKVAQTVVPAKIQSTADIQQAAQSLDSDQIDKNLDSTQLDADLNSML